MTSTITTPILRLSPLDSSSSKSKAINHHPAMLSAGTKTAKIFGPNPKQRIQLGEQTSTSANQFTNQRKRQFKDDPSSAGETNKCRPILIKSSEKNNEVFSKDHLLLLQGPTVEAKNQENLNNKVPTTRIDSRQSNNQPIETTSNQKRSYDGLEKSFSGMVKRSRLSRPKSANSSKNDFCILMNSSKLMSSEAHQDGKQEDNEKKPIHLAAQNGNLDVIKFFVKDLKADVNVKNNDGWTPLQIASKKGHLDIVKFLVHEAMADVDVKTEQGWKPIHIASQVGHLNVVKYLVNVTKVDVNVKEQDGWTPLHLASLNGHLNIVEFLYNQAKANVDMKTEQGWTPIHIASQTGQLDVVKYLVTKVDVNIEDQDGWTPLHLASLNGHLNVVKFLVDGPKADVNLKNEDGCTSHHIASQNGHLDIVKFLVNEAKADVNLKTIKGWTSLHIASQNGHLDVVKFLVNEAKADVNVKNHDGWTQLHIATQNGHLDVVKFLVNEAKVDVNVKTNQGSTPLHIASQNGHLNVVQCILNEAKADVNMEQIDGVTPLHIASQNGHLNVVQFLVNEAKADVNVKKDNGFTPLYIASHSGHLNVVQFLVNEAKADVNVKENTGATPLYIASQNGHLNVVQFLVNEAKAEVNARGKKEWTPLHTASQNGHLNVVQFLVNEAKADANVQTELGWSPLHIASQNGYVDVVKFLVNKANANVNLNENVGSTPLHFASHTGQLNVVKYLVKEAKTNVNLKENTGATPLHIASQNGHLDVVQFFVNEGKADVNVKENTGATPLFIASQNGHLDVVQFLVNKGKPDVNVKENTGATPLHIASQNGHLDVVQFLVNEGKADVNVKENTGATPLHIASQNGHLDIVKFFVNEAKANVNVNNIDEWTPLHVASQNGHLDLAKFFVNEAKTDVNLKENTGATPLHIASQNGHLDVVKFFVNESKADVNVKNHDGWTPLHILSQNGHLDLIKFLVNEAKTDVNLKENTGATPLHIASQNGHLEVVQFLVNEGMVDVYVKENTGATPLHIASQNGHLDVVQFFVNEATANVDQMTFKGFSPLQFASQEDCVLVNKTDVNVIDVKGHSNNSSETIDSHNISKGTSFQNEDPTRRSLRQIQRKIRKLSEKTESTGEQNEKLKRHSLAWQIDRVQNRHLNPASKIDDVLQAEDLREKFPLKTCPNPEGSVFERPFKNYAANKLTYKEASDLMDEASQSPIKKFSDADWNPNPGDIFIFAGEDYAKTKVKDKDGYKWKNNSQKKDPSGCTDIVKMYFSIQVPSSTHGISRKNIYFSPSMKLYLIHYMGDEYFGGASPVLSNIKYSKNPRVTKIDMDRFLNLSDLNKRKSTPVRTIYRNRNGIIAKFNKAQPSYVTEDKNSTLDKSDISKMLTKAHLLKDRLQDASKIIIDEPEYGELFVFNTDGLSKSDPLQSHLLEDGHTWKHKKSGKDQKFQTPYIKRKYFCRKGSKEITNFKKYIILHLEFGIIIIHYVGFHRNNPTVQDEHEKAFEVYDEINCDSNYEISENMDSDKDRVSVMDSDEVAEVEGSFSDEPLDKSVELQNIEGPNEPSAMSDTHHGSTLTVGVIGLIGLTTFCCHKPIDVHQSVLMFCKACSSFFHNQCVKESLCADKEWLCIFCQLQTSGVASGLPITSGLESFWTALTIKSLHEPEFKDVMSMDTSEGTKVLLRTIHHCAQGEFELARKTWFNYIHVSKQKGGPDSSVTNSEKELQSLKGSPEEMPYNYVKNGSTYNMISVCDNDNCKNAKVERSFSELYLEDTTELKSFFNIEKCKACGKQTTRTISMPKSGMSWYLLVKNCNSENTPEKLLKLQRKVWVDQTVLKLSMITLHCKKINHFTSLHLFQNTWLFYDSLVKGKTRFRYPTTEDLSQTAVNVIYLPETQKKKI